MKIFYCLMTLVEEISKPMFYTGEALSGGSCFSTNKRDAKIWIEKDEAETISKNFNFYKIQTSVEEFDFNNLPKRKEARR